MRRFRYTAIITCAVGLMLAFSADQVAAHLPDECAEPSREAEKRVGLYSESIGELRRILADESSNYLPEMQRTILLSVDAIEAASTAIACAAGMETIDEAMAEPPADLPSAPTTLEEILAFAEEHELALRIAGRCLDIQQEIIFGGRPSYRSFTDWMTDWAHAMREGERVLADSRYKVIVGRIEQAQEVLAEMQRLQITDREQYVFFDDYVGECRAKAIRIVAAQ